MSNIRVPLPRRALALAAVAAAILALPAGASAAISLKGVTLRIGGQTDGLQALLASSGVLKGKAYAIDWKTFTSGPPLVESLQSGHIDFGSVGNTPPIYAAATKANFRIVAGLQGRSHRQNHLIVPSSSSIRTLADLKGKTVAYTKGTISEAFLIQALGRAHLALKDVRLADLQPADALTAFNAGKVDAWVSYQPFLAIIGDKAREIPTGSGYVAEGLNVLVASTGALGNVKKRTAIRDYLVRLKRAFAWGDAHPDDWAQAFSSESNLPLAITKAAQSKLDVVPARANVTGPLQRLADLLNQAGQVKKVDIKSITSNQLAG